MRETKEAPVRLTRILAAAKYVDGKASISQELVGAIATVADEARAELDALTRERDEARAEAERLRPLPEIYAAWQKIILDGNPSRDTVAEFVEIAHAAAMRAAAAPPNLNPLPNRDADIAGLTHDLAEVKEIVAAGRYQRNLDVMTIAAQADVIDERNAQLAEARAEVERLRPAAEAWGALETLRPMFNAPLPVSAEAERNHYAAIEAADQKYQAAAARAREAAKEGK